MDRQGYFKLDKPQVVDADVYVHWSVLAASGLILAAYWQSPVQLVLACLCYFGIIFIHEVGHAVTAKQAGCRVFAIRVHLIVLKTQSNYSILSAKTKTKAHSIVYLFFSHLSY